MTKRYSRCKRSKRCKKHFMRNLLVISILIAITILAFDVRLEVTKYIVDAKEIESEVRIALITDLHSCYYGEHQVNLVMALERQNPDMVLLGGDFFDDDLPYHHAIAFLEAISGRYPIYYVTGNHEYWSKDVDTMLEIMERYKVVVLDGKYKKVQVRGEKINIGGVDDPDVYRLTDKKTRIEEELEQLRGMKNNGNYSILLSHRPEYYKEYQKYPFDLVLAGHAHGGQWRIPFLLNGLFAPDQGLFPKYAGGRYDFGDMEMIVSRGLARESTMVPRIFNRPELVMVYLR